VAGTLATYSRDTGSYGTSLRPAIWPEASCGLAWFLQSNDVILHQFRTKTPFITY